MYHLAITVTTQVPKGHTNLSRKGQITLYIFGRGPVDGASYFSSG